VFALDCGYVHKTNQQNGLRRRRLTNSAQKADALIRAGKRDNQSPPGRKLTEVKLLAINQLRGFMSFFGGSHEMMT
jgi:hypothetical protein